MGIAVKVENVSKQYRLGLVGGDTLREDIISWWYKMRGKEDPRLKVGEENDRSQKGLSEYVWALQQINFEVQQGEVLGIIGRNGAGKSTLLKILSKVTAPTTGHIKVKGRIASLLEVGTGFHPELTGKENIYLNGAILGMRRHEITRKLDEITDFAGVDRYLDTPVKRYSSGMYVRLAFAVAAHLESEILIVDEVLAVGDAEFQKKCLGKMGEVSKGEGRTILFVSHNMAAVKALCNRATLIQNGLLVDSGDVDPIISRYISGSSKVLNYRQNLTLSNAGFTLNSIRIVADGKNPEDPILLSDTITLAIGYENLSSDSYHFTIKLKGDDGQYFQTTTSANHPGLIQQGRHEAIMTIPAYFFNDSTFYLDLLVVANRREVRIIENDILCFTVNPVTQLGAWMGKEVGYVRGRFAWSSMESHDTGN